MHETAFNIAKNLKYDGYQRGLASKVYKFSDKKLSGNGIENLRPVIKKKTEKNKVNSPFIDNIWDSDLAEMQLISKFNKGFRFLLCVVDIYSR